MTAAAAHTIPARIKQANDNLTAAFAAGASILGDQLARDTMMAWLADRGLLARAVADVTPTRDALEEAAALVHVDHDRFQPRHCRHEACQALARILGQRP